MLTKYLTNVTASFSPFNARSGKTIRSFLAMLPPNARSTIAMDVKMFGINQVDQPARLALKFKDGKELELDLVKMKIRDIEAEVNRHSRSLLRKEELSGER
ncbi:hypothetical protein AMS68_000851 [Peltaster fructicola]|uniref:Large ribosomal subunit protein mL53 n=1 Tax=Peltaster fructicola TaxID=286661 RepID=A0A6H0XKS5_9PEZI|nr:hypothetical protein AMS68_000851 [Peltaster fructicola]